MLMIMGRKPWTTTYDIIGFTTDYQKWLNEHHCNSEFANYVDVKVLSVVDVTSQYPTKSLLEN